MSEMYVPADGEKVRVVLEGIVSRRGSYFIVGREGAGSFILPSDEHVVSVEKIEPPVVTFKSGDRLRRKGGGIPYEVTLACGGYIQHFEDVESEWYNNDGTIFTPEHYEKVYPINPDKETT